MMGMGQRIRSKKEGDGERTTLWGGQGRAPYPHRSCFPRPNTPGEPLGATTSETSWNNGLSLGPPKQLQHPKTFNPH